MEDTEFEVLVKEALEDWADEQDPTEFESWEFGVRTFEDEGVLTNDRGLVVQLPSGVEFQLTIVRSS